VLATAVFAELEFAIYAGVLLSLMLYLKRTSHPLMLDVKPDPASDSYHYTADSGLPDCPQVKMLRINGSLFFGAVDHVQTHPAADRRATRSQKHLLIVAGGINFVDMAGAEMLATNRNAGAAASAADSISTGSRMRSARCSSAAAT
jgi:sulfate permease, SulP family